jgi:radical SAM protein with 4Fe4S-binding SPASM domain
MSDLSVLQSVRKAAKEVRSLTLKQTVNTALNLAEARLQLPVVRSLPQNVDIVLTKACNLACTFCKDYETVGAKRVSVENFEKAARQLFPTARWVSICSGGEPYLHKGLEDLLRIARRYRVSSWVLSNGMLLKQDRIRTIIREGLITLHGFSVDGMKPATVEALRVNAKLDEILENIKMLLRVREEERKRKPGIVIRYALMRSNVEELPAAVEYWGELGIDRIDSGYLSVCNGIDSQESLYFHQDLMKRVFEEARKVASHYPKLSLRLPRTVEEEKSLNLNPGRCTAPWSFVNIDTNGLVLPCYRAFEAMNMGKVYDEDGESFESIWNNDSYRALRRTVNDDKVQKHFQYCSSCEYRFGWGTMAPHVGDETWMKLASLDAPNKVKAIDHRRRKTKDSKNVA